MLKVLGRANSVNVQKVLWAGDELGIPVAREDMGGSFGGLNSVEYLRMNPNGLVPTICDGSVVVWESNAIVRYLAAKYGEGSLWLADAGERAQSDKWMDWQLTTYWPEVRTIFIQMVRTSEAARNLRLIEDARLKAVEAARTLDAALAGSEFLAGPHLTMGDIAVGVVAYRFFALNIERPALPHLEAWYRRLAERPPFRHHVMQPLS
jgi:glutathione S-transferase